MSALGKGTAVRVEGVDKQFCDLLRVAAFDLAAMDHGYVRPPLKEFTRR